MSTGLFVNKETTVLLIVEGDTIEDEFFRCIASAFGISAKVIPYRTNIYKLYEALKQANFSANVCGILKESATEDDKKLFDRKYAAIYLVYDADFQHCDKGENELTIEQRIAKNMPRLSEMSKYFTDETDDTVGKLFINYPMMEAYKDCDAFFEVAYKDRRVSIYDLLHNGYKKSVSQRKVNGKAVKKLSYRDFCDIVKCAVYKYAFIMGNGWRALPYRDFITSLFSANLLGYESSTIDECGEVNVINLSVLFVLDYLGNNDGLYDSLAADVDTVNNNADMS